MPLILRKTFLRVFATAAIVISYSLGAQAFTPPILVSETDSVEAHNQVFDLNAARVNPSPRLKAFAARVDSAASAGAVTSVGIEGAASPDGRAAHNSRLAMRRALALKNYFLENCSLPDSIYSLSSIGEDWDGFLRILPEHLSGEDLAAVQAVIAAEPDRELCENRLRYLHGGRLWKLLTAKVFPHLRRASMTVALASGDSLAITVDSVANEANEAEDANWANKTNKSNKSNKTNKPNWPNKPNKPNTPNEPDPPAAPPAHALNWYLKTNVPAWAMLWTNLAVEFDCAEHWSVQLPVYYSGFNYFTSRRKFRTLALVPEARFWPRRDNQGFFVGAHLGVACYNVAFGGATRYQDHDGNTPALGGGINVGYRLPISRSGRWRLEFSLGAGIYRLDYDTFENRHNGLLTGRRQRTFFGVDNAAISVAYTFNLKGGRR